MAKGQYRGVNNVARKIVKEYRGVANVARKVKKVYRGVANVARLVFQNSLIAEPFSTPSNLTCNYTVADNGRTLKWEIINKNSENSSAFFRIYREGGFPSKLTVSYTLKQNNLCATIIGNEEGLPITYGNYANAFDYDGSTNGKYVDLETTYDDGTPDDILHLILNVKSGGTYTGEISNLTINGESVEFVL